jgi:hypothetical protein
MERHFIKALMYAWDQPRFREGLQHLIDLDEITGLLAALATGEQNGEAERRLAGLLRSALEEGEIRRALLVLIDDPPIREELKQGTAAELVSQPGLARAIGSALDDPAVREETRAALESGKVRAAIWDAVESQLGQRRLAMARKLIGLLVRHRHARKLVWALNKHGLYRELWQARKTL